jgi:uncharacterized repeat protein (TIGR04052 family)
VTLEFLATWNGQPVECGDASTSLTDLRFYVSNIGLLDTNDVEHELELRADSRWQQAGIALIDLENGEGACLNGSAAMNASVSGMVDANNIAGLRFTVGVPFDRNHANPLTAEPPLDDAAMHWHWRSGYKFLRAGITTDAGNFWLHLGSTGCEGTVQNISSCRSPNRVLVEISDFSPGTDQIEIDLSALFLNVDLNNGDRSNCSSGPAETSCAEPFAALGLALSEESPQPNSKSQSVFRARH